MTRPLLALLLATVAGPLTTADAAAAQDAADAAIAEMEVGRFWHAARHLRDLADGVDPGPEGRLLLARAEAGYLAWTEVRETLEGEEWLDTLAGGEGRALLARALEEEEAWAEAAASYRTYLRTPRGTVAPDRVAVQARLARALTRAEEAEEALGVLGEVRVADPIVASWVALELGELAAERGDTAVLRGMSDLIADPAVRSRGWELAAVAALAAGDSAAALDLYREWAGRGGNPTRSAKAHARSGDLTLAAGDSARAIVAYRAAFEAGPRSAGGADAARRLYDLRARTDLSSEEWLELARTLDRTGEDGPALVAYDRYLTEVGPSGVAEPVRLARARLLARTDDRQEEAVREYRALSTSEDTVLGAATLESWATLRRRQGRDGDVATLRRWLVERYPTSDQAVEYVFLRADAAHDRLALDRALEEYGRVPEMNPDHARAGLARMRSAMIHLQRGDTAGALDGFRTYLEEYPRGRRWDEASYWAGTLLLGTGGEDAGARGRELLASISERDPLSYYAVLAAEVLGEPYRVPGPVGAGVPPMPDWLARELAVVDLLEEAGLDEGRQARVAALRERALETSPDVTLRLAHELIGRALTIEGINLGWELQRRGAPWSRALLEVLYPFPNREMVEWAALERGLDPLLVAAVIRQESAFDPDIRSSAGAVGLMQVMPATGRQLARALGPEDFDVRSLEAPEINLHLGTSYLVDLQRRYDGVVPLVLSAYNAGPSRADRWRDFPEASDMLRFTERIPFAETRNYVKLVRRNLALYRALYGTPYTSDGVPPSEAFVRIGSDRP